MNDYSWQFFAELGIESGLLSLSDTSYFYDDFVAVRIPKGIYGIAAGLDDWGDVVSARIVSGESFVRGKALGRFRLEFAQVGFCDREIVADAFASKGNDGMSDYFDALSTGELKFGVISVPGVHMPFVRSDVSIGEVYELLSDDSIIGVEVRLFDEDDDSDEDEYEEDN